MPEAPSRYKLFESCTISEALSAIRGVAEFMKRLPHRVVYHPSSPVPLPLVSIFCGERRRATTVILFCFCPRIERVSRARPIAFHRSLATDRPFIFRAHNYRRPSMPNITDRRADRMAMRRKECPAPFPREIGVEDGRSSEIPRSFARDT